MHENASADFWEDLYTSGSMPVHPQPNAQLIGAVSDLPAGEALDLGSGNGGDAIWLARHGWHVTAVDISTTAVERLNERASKLSLDDKITATQHDVDAGFPPGRFDLINVHYLHTPFSLDRVRLLRAAAHALLPSGHLLVVDHGSTAPWSWNQGPDLRYPSPQEVYADLDMDPLAWQAVTAETRQRMATGPDGQTAEVTDHVLMIRRTSH
jgi:SAM-dependent methyltransferase